MAVPWLDRVEDAYGSLRGFGVVFVFKVNKCHKHRGADRLLHLYCLVVEEVNWLLGAMVYPAPVIQSVRGSSDIKDLVLPIVSTEGA